MAAVPYIARKFPTRFCPAPASRHCLERIRREIVWTDMAGRGKKRLPAQGKERRQASAQRKQGLSYHFMSEALWSGLRFKTSNVIDEFNLEDLRIEVNTSLQATRVIRALDELVKVRGASLSTRMGNGPELVNLAMMERIAQRCIATVLNDPNKPSQHGTDETFNGKFREERLSIERFRSHREAVVVIETCCQRYNQLRPHSSRQYLTPVGFKQQLRQAAQPAIL